MSELLPVYRMGYSIRNEDREYLDDMGTHPSQLMAMFQDTFPRFDITADPLGAIDILNQQNQGACQGHALALQFSICYFLATARREAFSRACGYYLAQRHDGIRGDNGSTLSGGMWVATQHGMCLESDWPYPYSYNPREPSGVPYAYKLKATKIIRSIADFNAWIDLGLPIQDGIAWNDSCSVEVVDNYRNMRGSGGHSTTFWLRTKSGNVRKENSWGGSWCGDGCNEWTEASIVRLLQDPNTTMIGYAPDEMSFPAPAPIGL